MKKVYRITMQEQDAQGEFTLTDIVEFETDALGNIFEVIDEWREQAAQRDRDACEADQFAQAYEMMAANPVRTLEHAMATAGDYWQFPEVETMRVMRAALRAVLAEQAQQ